MATAPPPFLQPYVPNLWQVNPLISAGLQSVLSYISSIFHSSDPQPTEWRHIEWRFQRVGNITPRDVWATTFDIVKYSSGTVQPWTPSDDATVDPLLAALWTNLLSVQPVQHASIDRRYYRRVFNPPTDTKPFPPTGPPLSTFVDARAGTNAANAQADQVAWTSTDKTPYAKHWGRNYWPGPTAAGIDSTGHISAAYCDVLRTVVGTLYDALQAANFFPVVVVTQIDKAAARGLLNVTQVQVDNVPDIVRRRRPSQTTYRTTHP